MILGDFKRKYNLVGKNVRIEDEYNYCLNGFNNVYKGENYKLVKDNRVLDFTRGFLDEFDDEVVKGWFQEFINGGSIVPLHDFAKAWKNSDEGIKMISTDGKALYQITGTETFGHVIAKNSQNKYVFEEKGTGNIKVVDEKELEEVVPYTVELMSVHDDSYFTIESEQDKLKINDLILGANNSLYRVVKVNTKTKNASKLDIIGKLHVNPL